VYKCRLVYDEWKCIKEKNIIGINVNNAEYNGYLGLIRIGQVQEKQVWKYNGCEITVCDNGYKWLTIMPSNEFYCITVMMDKNYQICVCYIDIIDSQGVDIDGVPYYYDIYLDLIVFPDGKIVVDDMDELEEALEKSIISKIQYDKALSNAKRLQNELLADEDIFLEFIRKRLSEIKDIEINTKKK